MHGFLLVALIGLIPIGLTLLFVYRVLAARVDCAVTPGVSIGPAPQKYRSMERLLSDDDDAFLAQQPNVSWRVRSSLRRQRRLLFRRYLHSLRSDFGRVFAACQAIVVHSAEDRGDLAARVIRLQLHFALGMLAVEGRLLLHAAGVPMIDVRPFIESLQAIQAQARLILAMPQTA